MKIYESNWKNPYRQTEQLINAYFSKQNQKKTLDQPFIKRATNRGQVNKGGYCQNTLQDLLTGHLKNSYGVEGMDITGRSDYKRTVKLSDDIKEHIINQLKEDYYVRYGKCGEQPVTDAYYDKIHDYIKSVKKEDRAAAAWTIDQMQLDLAEEISTKIKEKNPSWEAGKPIDPEVLDEIFQSDAILGQIGKKTTAVKGFDARI